MYFARVAKSVTLVVRGDGLERSMSHYLIEQLRALDNVRVRTCSVVEEVHGDGASGGPDDPSDLLRVPSRRCSASHVFVFIGAQPRTDWLAGVLDP